MVPGTSPSASRQPIGNRTKERPTGPELVTGEHHRPRRAAGDDRAARMGGPKRGAHAAFVERVEQVAGLPARQVDEVGLPDRGDRGRVVGVLGAAHQDRLDLRPECREVRLALRGPAPERLLAVWP